MSCSKGSLIVDHTVQTRTDSTATVVTSANSLVSGTTTFTMGTEQVSAISANITYGNNEGIIHSRMKVKSYILIKGIHVFRTAGIMQQQINLQ